MLNSLPKVKLGMERVQQFRQSSVCYTHGAYQAGVSRD